MKRERKYPVMPFDTGDWLKCPELRAVPPDVRGLWMDNTVTGITKAGDNVGVLIEALIYCSHVDIYIRVLLLYAGYALWSSYKAHEADIVAAALLKHLEGVACAAAGCKHGVRNNNKAMLDIFRKLAEVHYWLMILWTKRQLIRTRL